MPASPFLGEIMPFAGNFAPTGWLACQGQLLSIAQYDALFSLIGTTYGGNGTTNFALPDLRGRVPIHSGQGPGLPNYVVGQTAGAESATVSVAQLPAHSHAAATAGAGNAPVPTGGVPAPSRAADPSYGPPAGGATMPAGAVSASGAASPQSHENTQPFLAINFCIAVSGIYPSPN